MCVSGHTICVGAILDKGLLTWCTRLFPLKLEALLQCYIEPPGKLDDKRAEIPSEDSLCKKRIFLGRGCGWNMKMFETWMAWI